MSVCVQFKTEATIYLDDDTVSDLFEGSNLSDDQKKWFLENHWKLVRDSEIAGFIEVEDESDDPNDLFGTGYEVLSDRLDRYEKQLAFLK
tara:strand:+ start:1380 stop:1649 length:270 start_codon:yes stop_codon:yes gene_type:complete